MTPDPQSHRATIDVVLTAPQVCRRAGITYRQLDYWCRVGMIRPERDARGSGTQRKFTEAQARGMRLAAALMRAGATTSAISALVARMTDAPEWQWSGTIVVGIDGAVLDDVAEAGWIVNLDTIAGRSASLLAVV